MPSKHDPANPRRSFKIPDWPYLPALAKAREQGTTLSRKVREWMAAWVEGRLDVRQADDDEGWP